MAKSNMLAKWLRLGNGARCRLDAVASIAVNEEKLMLFVKGDNGDILISFAAEDEEVLANELVSINEQLDA